MLAEYDGKKFVNICDNDLNLDSEDEKKALERGKHRREGYV